MDASFHAGLRIDNTGRPGILNCRSSGACVRLLPPRARLLDPGTPSHAYADHHNNVHLEFSLGQAGNMVGPRALSQSRRPISGSQGGSWLKREHVALNRGANRGVP